jgi:sugar (pentulose or hexulose) kinase
MLLLGIDIGSSSVKVALLSNGRIVGRTHSCDFHTRYDGVRVEVDPDAVLEAMVRAIRAAGPKVRRVDAIALSAMSPSWVAMDRRGRAMTPIITHQDRRSIETARRIERSIGKARHLRLTGNRPFPGGISSTTCAWFGEHHPGVLARADLVGHLSTFAHRLMTGARVTDPSNASFMGLYQTIRLDGWNDELCEAAGVRQAQLPQVMEADRIAGRITSAAAARFGVTHGTPMMAGIVDGSSPMLLAGARVGQLVNASGSTDVLALCTDRPRPHPGLLTRALGIGRLWLHVATMAAAGSALNWARQTLFADLPDEKFWSLVRRQSRRNASLPVRFEPYLAGERVSIEQRRGAFTGLSLASTREDMLAAVIEALARVSAERLPLLESRGVKLLRDVTVCGGVSKGLADVLQRDWPGRWRFRQEPDATVRGLGTMVPKA